MAHPTTTQRMSLLGDFYHLFEEEEDSDTLPTSTATTPPNPLKAEYIGTDGIGCHAHNKSYVRPPKSRRHQNPLRTTQQHIRCPDISQWRPVSQWAQIDFDNNKSTTEQMIKCISLMHYTSMYTDELLLALSDLQQSNTSEQQQQQQQQLDKCMKLKNLTLLHADETSNALATLQRQLQRLQQQQQLEDANNDNTTTCPICHGYLPTVGAQCFPCIGSNDQ